MSIGLGSNRFKLQPKFVINGTHFLLTNEQVWAYKNTPRKKPIRLHSGNLSYSAIDSIMSLAKTINAQSVYKANPGVMSGGNISLTIKALDVNLKFQLDNAHDSTAEKVVSILNKYIPASTSKLWISDVDATIVDIK